MASRWYLSILLITLLQYGSSIRVCETFDDYLDSSNKHCMDNSDAESNVTQILERWGCTVKEHYIVTEDGYEILIIQAYTNISKTTPIIMAHGILMNSLSFVGKYNKTTAYHLITKGYQVFLVNFRGTRYSSRHLNYTGNERSFWDFNCHEMAVYDLRSSVNLVFTLTNHKAIIIAFSMGTTVSLIYTSTHPVEAEQRLKGLILMAPVRTFKGSLSLLKIVSPMWITIRPFIDALWNGQILPRDNEIDRFCSSGPGAMYICETLIVPMVGEDYAQMDPLYLPVTNMLYKDRTGINVIDHFVQIMLTGHFKQLDFGLTRNMELYGSVFPPAYDVSSNTIPTALFVGDNDWIASPLDATALSVLLGPSLCGLTFISDPKWNHLDFVVGNDMNFYLNTPLMAKVAQIDEGRCP